MFRLDAKQAPRNLRLTRNIAKVRLCVALLSVEKCLWYGSMERKTKKIVAQNGRNFPVRNMEKSIVMPPTIKNMKKVYCCFSFFSHLCVQQYTRTKVINNIDDQGHRVPQFNFPQPF